MRPDPRSGARALLFAGLLGALLGAFAAGLSGSSSSFVFNGSLVEGGGYTGSSSAYQVVLVMPEQPVGRGGSPFSVCLGPLCTPESLSAATPTPQPANFTRITLDCPATTQGNTTRIDATYYQEGLLACGAMTLNASSGGNTTYLFTTLCNNGTGRYSFTNVTTRVGGAYTIWANTSDASASCMLNRVSAARTLGFPDLPWWLAFPLALAALGLLRRRYRKGL